MTLPIQALAQNPYQENQDDVPSWRKAAIAAQNQSASQLALANSPSSATPSQAPEQNILTQNISQLNQSSANNVANAQASAATQKGYEAQYQQNLFNYNTQQAQAAYQKSASQAYQDLQQKYLDLANQIPGNQQYTNPNLPGYTPPTGNGTSGSNQPVTYSGRPAELAQMARNAGFPESAIPYVVAIAQAESSGRSDATHQNNDSHGSIDYGLMQINSYWQADLLKKYNWEDPQQNLQAAYQVYKNAGNSFSPWSTFNSGAYNQYMHMGEQAAQSVVRSGPVSVTAQTASGLRQNIIQKAETYIGLPYEWGGTDLSKGVDCSGLVQQVYKKFGINLPRTSYDQYGAAGGNATWGVRTSMNQLEPGDLVYFKHSNGQVHHVAIWLGSNQILEAQMTGTTVHIRNLGPNDVPYGVHLYNLDPAQPAPTQGPGPK